MRRKIFAVLVVAVGVAFAGYNMVKLQNEGKALSDLVLANMEALASDTEYEIGSPGTNWKTYRIQCTKTVGVDYVVTITKTYTYWTDACGKGSGTCLSPAGC